MRRNLWKLLLGLALLGCGGQPAGPAIGFVNQTKHSDADLWMIWQAAQDSLAQEVDLNPPTKVIFGCAGGHPSRRPARHGDHASPASSVRQA